MKNSSWNFIHTVKKRGTALQKKAMIKECEHTKVEYDSLSTGKWSGWKQSILLEAVGSCCWLHCNIPDSSLLY